MTPPSEQERAERRLFDGVSRASENPLDFYCTSTATGFRYLGPTGSAPIKQALSGKNSLLRMPGRAADINQRSVVGYSRNCAAAAAARQAPGSNDDCPNSNRDRLLSHTKESYTRPVAQTKLQAADSSSVASKKQPGPYSTNFSFHHMAQTSVPEQSMSSIAFQVPSAAERMDAGPPKSLKALEKATSLAQSSYSRHYDPNKRPWQDEGGHKRLCTEFEESFEDPRDITSVGQQHQQLPNTVSKRELSAYSKSQHAPVAARRLEPPISLSHQSFRPFAQAPLTASVSADTTNNSSGFVRNHSTGIGAANAVEPRRECKGRVDKRALYEGNIELLQPYREYMKQPARHSHMHQPRPLTQPPQQTKIQHALEVPANVANRPRETHWKV